jgi:hypothetical protein
MYQWSMLFSEKEVVLCTPQNLPIRKNAETGTHHDEAIFLSMLKQEHKHCTVLKRMLLIELSSN